MQVSQNCQVQGWRKVPCQRVQCMHKTMCNARDGPGVACMHALAGTLQASHLPDVSIGHEFTEDQHEGALAPSQYRSFATRLPQGFLEWVIKHMYTEVCL